uniref:Uncharacterized protein n=1 Tax=Compsopogon caeruleus TaxID=31354 RepID=A0A7S1XHH9_9RHOD|mmetsp:Transcript_9098/g.18426  ORF Transcript_9098/g.18426 Transcript_9098/m.18426 type:complete len:531 (+) Transcript_9098:496-2088(+)
MLLLTKTMPSYMPQTSVIVRPSPSCTQPDGSCSNTPLALFAVGKDSTEDVGVDVETPRWALLEGRIPKGAISLSFDEAGHLAYVSPHGNLYLKHLTCGEVSEPGVALLQNLSSSNIEALRTAVQSFCLMRDASAVVITTKRGTLETLFLQDGTVGAVVTCMTGFGLVADTCRGHWGILGSGDGSVRLIRTPRMEMETELVQLISPEKGCKAPCVSAVAISASEHGSVSFAFGRSGGQLVVGYIIELIASHEIHFENVQRYPTRVESIFFLEVGNGFGSRLVVFLHNRNMVLLEIERDNQGKVVLQGEQRVSLSFDGRVETISIRDSIFAGLSSSGDLLVGSAGDWTARGLQGKICHIQVVPRKGWDSLCTTTWTAMDVRAGEGNTVIVAIGARSGVVLVVKLTLDGRLSSKVISWKSHALSILGLRWSPQQHDNEESPWLLSVSEDGFGEARPPMDREESAVQIRGHAGGKVLCGAWIQGHESKRLVLTGGEDHSFRIWDLDKQPPPLATAHRARGSANYRGRGRGHSRH